MLREHGAFLKIGVAELSVKWLLKIVKLNVNKVMVTPAK
jgi:hypothetical protein